MTKIYSILATALLLGGTTSMNAKTLPPQLRAARAAATIDIAKPKALPATNITTKGFTSNWEPVDNAEAYCVFVYTKSTVPADGEYNLVEEGFDGVDFGSLVNPVWHEEPYEVLDAYTNLPNWSVYGYASFVGGMVGGVVYSPYIDLRANNGNYNVTVTVYATQGDEIRIESNGKDGKTIKTFTCENSGLSTATVPFENGVKDTFFSIVNMTATEIAPAYVDNVVVSQNLKKGDTVWTMVALNEAVEAPKTSATFASLPFAPQATEVYYDLYATAIDYNTPNGSLPYTSYYSDFSDMVTVDLAAGTSSSVLAPNATASSIKTLEGAIRVNLPSAQTVAVYTTTGQTVYTKTLGSGEHEILLPSGIYIVRTALRTQKIAVY